MNPRTTLRRLGIAVSLVTAGQLVLLGLGPLTRAGRAFGGSAGPGGVALLSSDSLYYLSLAENPALLENAPVTRVALPLILRLGAAAGSAEAFAVAMNFLVFTLAAMALYDLAKRLSGSSSAGVLAAAALTINPLTSQWVRFVLTESLTYAAVVAIMWSVVHLTERRSVDALALVIGSGVFLSLLRPNGVLFFAGALAAVVQTSRTKQRNGPVVIMHLLIWGAALFVFFLGSQEPASGSERTSQLVIGLLYDGVVVEGTPDVLVTTPMPEPFDRSDQSFTAALEYAAKNPLDVARLGLLRVGYETLQLRPHYPIGINLAMAVGVTVFAIFVMAGVKSSRSRSLTITVLMIAVPQAILIAATFAVPESRYGWASLVTLCAWAGIGADRVLHRMWGSAKLGGSVELD